MQPTEKNRQMNKDRLSIPGDVVKKDQSRGARHGPTVRQTLQHCTLSKAQNKKNGCCNTILERWHKGERYRKSLSEHGWTEEQFRQYDALALEDQSFVATPEERGRYKKSWKVSLNKEGTQGPLQQRPDFREAKHRYLQLYNEHVERTGEGNSPIHLAHQTRHHSQQFEGLEEYNCTVDPRTGWRFYPATKPTSSSSSVHWEQHDNWKSNQSWGSWRSSTWTEHSTFLCREVLWQKLDINDLNKQTYDIDYRAKVEVTKSSNTRFCTGEPVAKVISTPFFLVQVFVFRLPETFNSLATDGMCKQVQVSHAIFERVQKFTVCLHSFAQCTCIHHATCVAQSLDCVSCKKSRPTSRAMSHAMTHGTRSTSSSSFFLCSWSSTTATVDHILSTLRRSTASSRGWQLSWTTSSHTNQKNPPDELSHDDSKKKKTFGRITRSKVRILTHVFNCLHDSNSNVRPGWISSELVLARTVWWSHSSSWSSSSTSWWSSTGWQERWVLSM